ncbi:MAG TPA: 2-dehydropantoate 2-reductase [Quisquiliibacterium sp.]|nr:2-dehydropantoate 2-reductase [Quisquiliibacterium sp.]HQP68542.1 2-dehydropantoate 2-reductase [Quisquiliibacterium sp.]
MKIAVVGAGAIGGYLGARLALAGEDVTFIARGANLAALRASGIRLIEEDGSAHAVSSVRAVQSMAEAGPQDYVLLTLKAHQVGAVAADLPALFGAETALVTMQNGIPWWYFHRLVGPYEGRRVTAVDPDGAIATHVDNDRVIGSVVYPASELIEPGVVKVIEGNRFSLGEPDNGKSARALRLSEALTRAGFKAPVSTDLRSEIWLKLWGNLTFNPVSALTHATLAQICRFPQTRALAEGMMREAQTVAEKLGVRFRISLDKRIAGAEAVGEHKTSMLQDVERGRALELDALLGSVVELARMTGTDTPRIDAIHACAALLAHTLDTQQGRLEIRPRDA